MISPTLKLLHFESNFTKGVLADPDSQQTCGKNRVPQLLGPRFEAEGGVAFVSSNRNICRHTNAFDCGLGKRQERRPGRSAREAHLGGLVGAGGEAGREEGGGVVAAHGEERGTAAIAANHAIVHHQFAPDNRRPRRPLIKTACLWPTLSRNQVSSQTDSG